MNYGSVLPVTGGAGALIAGHMFGLDDIIGAAIVIVLAGIAAYRFGSRLNRGRTTTLVMLAALAAGAAVAAHLAGLPWAFAVELGVAAAVAALYLITRAARHARPAAVRQGAL